jgi:hypothetical protein
VLRLSLAFAVLMNDGSSFLLTTLEASLDVLFSICLVEDVRPLRLEIKRVCEGLLPDAVGMTDGFGFSDWEVRRTHIRW